MPKKRLLYRKTWAMMLSVLLEAYINIKIYGNTTNNNNRECITQEWIMDRVFLPNLINEEIQIFKSFLTFSLTQY